MLQLIQDPDVCLLPNYPSALFYEALNRLAVIEDILRTAHIVKCRWVAESGCSDEVGVVDRCQKRMIRCRAVDMYDLLATVSSCGCYINALSFYNISKGGNRSISPWLIIVKSVRFRWLIYYLSMYDSVGMAADVHAIGNACAQFKSVFFYLVVIIYNRRIGVQTMVYCRKPHPLGKIQCTWACDCLCDWHLRSACTSLWRNDQVMQLIGAIDQSIALTN